MINAQTIKDSVLYNLGHLIFDRYMFYIPHKNGVLIKNVCFQYEQRWDLQIFTCIKRRIGPRACAKLNDNLVRK